MCFACSLFCIASMQSIVSRHFNQFKHTYSKKEEDKERSGGAEKRRSEEMIF